MARRRGSRTAWSPRVTVERSTISRATVLPSALSRRVTLTVPAAVAIGSRARGLASLTIWSRTGPAGRSSASRGRLDGQPETGCSACGTSSWLSSRRLPRRARSYSSTSPARFSRQSKVSSQVRWRAPLPGAPGSAATPKAWPSTSRTADTGSCAPGASPVSPISPPSSNPRRSSVIGSGSPSGESYRRSPYALYTPASGHGPGHTGGGEDLRGPGHGRLGAGPGDSRGARGGSGLDGVRGRDAGRQGDGERPDERVARPHGVDGRHAEAFDGDRADRAVC